MMKKQGKVWLVGAGPGDAGLLTIKGKKILEQAEVVVYDSLVGDSVLSMIPRTARLINVGKRAGNHLMKQEGINQVLLEVDIVTSVLQVGIFMPHILIIFMVL